MLKHILEQKERILTQIHDHRTALYLLKEFIESIEQEGFELVDSCQYSLGNTNKLALSFSIPAATKDMGEQIVDMIIKLTDKIEFAPQMYFSGYSHINFIIDSFNLVKVRDYNIRLQFILPTDYIPYGYKLETEWEEPSPPELHYKAECAIA